MQRHARMNDGILIWIYQLKQYRGFILFVSVMSLLFILVQVWHAKTAQEDLKQEQERQLKGLALLMRIGTPKLIDESTRLDSVTYQDGVMRIAFTLTTVSKNDFDSEVSIDDRKSAAASVSCEDKALGPFIKSGLLIHYIVNGSNNSPITEFQLSNSDCP